MTPDQKQNLKDAVDEWLNNILGFSALVAFPVGWAMVLTLHGAEALACFAWIAIANWLMGP